MPAQKTVTILFLLGAMICAAPVRATPISEHSTLVAVNPPGHFDDGPLFKKAADELDNIPDFFRGMDESRLPDGYIVRGNGVTLFYTGTTASPAVSAASTLSPFQLDSAAIENPEPASLVLLGTGLLLAVKLHARRPRR